MMGNFHFFPLEVKLVLREVRDYVEDESDSRPGGTGPRFREPGVLCCGRTVTGPHSGLQWCFPFSVPLFLLHLGVPIFGFRSFSRLCSNLVTWLLPPWATWVGHLHFNSGSLGQTPISLLAPLPVGHFESGPCSSWKGLEATGDPSEVTDSHSEFWAKALGGAILVGLGGIATELSRGSAQGSRDKANSVGCSEPMTFHLRWKVSVATKTPSVWRQAGTYWWRTATCNHGNDSGC